MNKILSTLVIVVLFATTAKISHGATDKTVLNFLNERFGMFIHFNMSTFHGEQWAKTGHDPKSFNPKKLDCNQWAEAAASAKMSYGVFTTKHHDGFCLWDSKVTKYDVASSSFKGDVVKEYADAFRKKGLKVGLYFSVWDKTKDVAQKKITPEKIEYTKTQLTELLTNYGEIFCLVIDGWGSVWGKSPTFTDIPYNVLADHIHSIQPNCLVINHSCNTDRAVSEIIHYEATHGQHCPNDNTIPSQQGPTIQPKWFWEKGYEKLDLKPLSEILSELDFCNSRCANYLLNAAPNDQGLMDDNVVERLAEVGKAWKKPAPMTKLVKETKSNATVKATASSVEGTNSAENVLDSDLFTVWQAKEGDKNPTVILDYGKKMKFNSLICGEPDWGNIAEFEVGIFVKGKRKVIAKGTDMKAHQKLTFKDVSASKFYLTVTKFKKAPRIREVTFVKYNQF